MPLAVRTPVNPAAPPGTGAYPRALNVLSRKETAVQRQLRRAGLAGYEPLTQATLLTVAQYAPPHAAVYDIGAHIGLYAALVDLVHGAKRLQTVAFEPTPRTAKLCRRLRDGNGLDFDVRQMALSDRSRTAELYLSLKAESSNSLNAAHRAHTEAVRVPVGTVDGFAERHGHAPYLIKIDVETHEPEVLAGAAGVLREHRPWIVCEVLPSTDPAAMAAALSHLTELGYGLHLIHPETPWPAHDATSYAPHVQGECRDWLFAPEPLADEFYAAQRAWLRAVLACGKEENVLVPPGEPFPRDWNAPHGGPGAPPRPRRGPAARLPRMWRQAVGR
ncbi:FkbM family methyltransferase [Streptomyces sp. WAC 06738]|uniref:FkbM family methyltransferase n=1 Tax=Streptomyces sp. WAC 06738 TaxID=2203210 RepID=UPI000F6D4FDC|nr:FkbM family methyltransferase [Streptomyces sp. WAC 06738]AZM46332.1 FkbM family methyltransferase [Streptomyces sp. WAC 06738]